MSGSGAGVAPPDIQRPLAKDGGLDERLIPHCLPHLGMFTRDITYRLDGDQCDLDGGERFDVMTGTPQDGIVQIDEISPHVERENLPAAVTGNLVPERISRKQKTGVGG